MNRFIFIIYFITSVLLYSCEEKPPRYIYSKKKDSIFISNQQIHNWLKDAFNKEEYLWHGILNDQIIYYVVRDKHDFHFFFKEIRQDHIRRFFYTFNDNALYFVPEYDSLHYDYQRVSNNYYSFVSSKFYKIPELRKKNKKYNEIIKNATDIKKLEKLVNEMTIFNNLSFDDDALIDLLKKMFIITQMQIINVSENEKYVYYKVIFGIENAYEIKTKKDLEVFQKRLHDDYSIYRLGIFNYFFFEKYSFNVKKNLQGKLKNIKKDYQYKSVFYFYTLNDFKLFRLKIKIENGKIFLIKNYINSEYLWSSWYYPDLFLDGQRYY